jgi:uncharacterized protein (DUF1800 family)
MPGPRRELLLGVTAALQAVFFAAACSYDRRRVHPLRARRTQVAHLLRRAGFGYGEQELDEYEALGLAGAVDRLLDYDRIPDDSDQRAMLLSLDLKKLGDLQKWWLFRMVYTRRPLQEKMTLFWHGLLTSATGKVGLPNPTPQNPSPPQYMLDQHNFLRQHALDHFESLIAGISKDPAMMVWLDAQVNNKGKPNENYARELMELFTLGATGPDGVNGAAPYTEQDVREVARALTGRGLDQGRFVMRPAQFDTGMKTILGKTGPFGADDVFRIVTQHPTAPWYLARRLFRFFAHPSPTQADLEPLVAAYKQSDGSMRAVLRALFLSDGFYSERAYRALVKSPAELVAGAMRALGGGSVINELPGRTTRMGQALFNPPNVAGWPGGVDWISTSTWLERVNFANALVSSRENDRLVREAVARHGLTTGADLVQYYGDLLLDGQVSPEMRRVLHEYAGNGNGRVGAASRLTPEFLDRKGRGIAYLFMASPVFQLA